MLLRLKNFLKLKDLVLPLPRAQKELLELLMINKIDFDAWSAKQPAGKIRFQFFYPTAIDFYFDEFKLFTAFYKKNRQGEIELHEMKMTEVNYDSIRCKSWTPFEEVLIDFLTTLEESKKVALFEKRKTLFEYQSLCNKNAGVASNEGAYAKEVTSSPLHLLKTSQ